MATDILIPQLGNEITEAEMTEWLVKLGDEVAEGDPVLTITTTKMAIDLDAPAAGKLAEILVEEGELVEVGTVVGRIE
jgi:pyruvate/2-oxoglutarate dehydrogenase complex dihydrolipoamide acyltransferase (E2) component